MLLDLAISGLMVQVSIVQVIDMAIVLKGCMATVLAV